MGLHAGLHYELLFWTEDKTPPLVVLPGMQSDGRQLRRLLRELRRKALVIDPLGSGGSEAPAAASDYTLSALVPRLCAVLDDLFISHADLIGFSMGGMWAQHALLQDQAASRRGRWRSAVLVGTCADISPRLRSILLGLRAMWQHDVPQLDAWRILQSLLFAPDFLERPSTIPLLEILFSESRTTRAAAICQLDAMLGHHLGSALLDIRGVRCIIGGQYDLLMPPSTQGKLAAALGGVAVEILAGAGHAMWIEQAKALAELISAALPD